MLENFFCQAWLAQRTHAPMELSTSSDADNVEKAYCLGVKYEMEGQPTFPGDSDKTKETVEFEVIKLLKSTAHFSSILAIDKKPHIKVSRLHN